MAPRYARIFLFSLHMWEDCNLDPHQGSSQRDNTLNCSPKTESITIYPHRCLGTVNDALLMRFPFFKCREIQKRNSQATRVVNFLEFNNRPNGIASKLLRNLINPSNAPARISNHEFQFQEISSLPSCRISTYLLLTNIKLCWKLL
jgi:hypothetical protein